MTPASKMERVIEPVAEMSQVLFSAATGNKTLRH
jgi:hypothetical protein